MLATYSDFRSWKRLLWKIGIMGPLLAFCFVYGAAFALFGPGFYAVIAIPLVILALAVIWALPDAKRAPLDLIVQLFFISIVLDYVWPNYLAVSLPGLPWITISRLVGFPLLLLTLVCLSTSPLFRTRSAALVKELPWFTSLLVGFLFIQILSVALSANKGESINKLVSVLVNAPKLLIGLYAFTARGQIKKLAITIWGVAIFVGIIGIWQYRLHHVPWAGHIPSFLQINDPVVQQAQNGSGRAYTNIYRINSTFVTSLGLSEFMALVFPFVIFFLVTDRSIVTRCLAAISLPFMFWVVILTNSRLGVVGCLLSTCLYPAFLGIRRWRRERGSLLAPAVSLAYPALFAALVASTFFVGKLKVHVWGGGAQAASTDSRVEQIRMGVPLILHNPIGYGIGRGAYTLNYSPFGYLTIDSYYLLIALEYGIIGFLLYYGLIASGVVKAARLSISVCYSDSEQGLSVPICVALISFIIMKGVFAQPDNVNLVYTFLMAIAALDYRARERIPQIS